MSDEKTRLFVAIVLVQTMQYKNSWLIYLLQLCWYKQRKGTTVDLLVCCYCVSTNNAMKQQLTTVDLLNCCYCVNSNITREQQLTHLFVATVLVQTMYSISSVYGFWKLMLLVRSQIHSWVLAARNRYITDITWPFNFSTVKHSTKDMWHQLQHQDTDIYISNVPFCRMWFEGTNGVTQPSNNHSTVCSKHDD
jgi:hypothetical protein